MSNISPVFSKFNEALSDLEKQIKVCVATNAPAQYGDMLALAHFFIKTGHRFYVPQSINVIDGREYDDEVKATIRLPFDVTVLLTETQLRETNEPSWDLTIAVTAEVAEKYKIVNVDKVKCISSITGLPIPLQEGYHYVLIAIVKHPKGWAMIPGIQIVTVPVNSKGLYAICDFFSECKPLIKSADINLQQEFSDNFNEINNLCVLLGLNNVTKHEQLPPLALNKKRIRNDKPPLYSYHVLTVDGEVWDRDTVRSDKEDHLFRSHFRRGHIRRLDPERRVWVRSCFVHGNLPGFVDKDYQVAAHA